MGNLTIEEQLFLLKEQTKRFQCLFEPQVLQLRRWPLLAISNAKKSQFQVDFDEKLIKFQVVTKGRQIKDLRNRLDWLVKSVKCLLGDEWSIEVELNGRKVT